MARSGRSAKTKARQSMMQLNFKERSENQTLKHTYDKSIAKGGVACPFPWRLHEMLEATEREGLSHLVSWQSHGRSFTVRDPKEFAERIMCRFFSQTKYASFQRQLNLYGFSRLQHGPDKGAYFHLCFVRGQREKVRDMVRRKIKGTKVRRTMKPEEEPNFYDPKWNSKGTSKKTSTKGSARELGTKSLSLHEAVINSVKNKPESHFSESKVVSPPTIPEKVGHAPSSVPTTWDAFDEVKDNDFFFLDGSNFFDDELLDMSLLPSDRHANDSGNCFSFDPVARGLKKTASAVSMDQLCNTTA